MLENPQPIYPGRKFYVPFFEIKIGGAKQERDVVNDILQVSYKDSLSEIDSFEITINNWDARTCTFKYSDEDRFDPGKTVEVLMGYFDEGPQRLMLTGEITSLRPSFPAGGQPTLAISGLNVLHRLRRKQESQPYRQKKDSEIAKEIARRLGVEIKVNEDAASREQPYKYLLQYSQYDILFLLERARRIGYELYVEETGSGGQGMLHFEPSANVRRDVYLLTYGLSLIDFQPDLTTAHQVNKVTVHSWDPVKKKQITGVATRDKLDISGVGAAGGQPSIDQSFVNREEIITDRPVADDKEAEILAKETLERIAKDMIRGTGSVVGWPFLRAGSVVYLTGLGVRFSGRYFVTGTTHTIGDSGYTTQFECRREELK